MLERRALTIREFANLYGLNHKTVQVDVTRNPKKLPRVTKIGASIRFTMAAINEWEVLMTAE